MFSEELIIAIAFICDLFKAGFNQSYGFFDVAGSSANEALMACVNDYG